MQSDIEIYCENEIPEIQRGRNVLIEIPFAIVSKFQFDATTDRPPQTQSISFNERIRSELRGKERNSSFHIFRSFSLQETNIKIFINFST